MLGGAAWEALVDAPATIKPNAIAKEVCSKRCCTFVPLLDAIDSRPSSYTPQCSNRNRTVRLLLIGRSVQSFSHRGTKTRRIRLRGAILSLFVSVPLCLRENPETERRVGKHKSSAEGEDVGCLHPAQPSHTLIRFGNVPSLPPLWALCYHRCTVLPTTV